MKHVSMSKRMVHVNPAFNPSLWLAWLKCCVICPEHLSNLLKCGVLLYISIDNCTKLHHVKLVWLLVDTGILLDPHNRTLFYFRSFYILLFTSVSI